MCSGAMTEVFYSHKIVNYKAQFKDMTTSRITVENSRVSFIIFQMTADFKMQTA